MRRLPLLAVVLIAAGCGGAVAADRVAASRADVERAAGVVSP